MSIFQSIVLGLLQGLAEFLPISSSGHLVLFQGIFGITEATQTFNILLHIATLIGVFIVYWKDIWELIKNPFQRTTYLLIVATMPTVIVALLFADKVDIFFAGGKNLGFAFIFTGFILLYSDSLRNGSKRMRNMSYFDAIVIGVFQAIAITPGISRSGMTITGSITRGLDRNNAAKFSFLLSIPAILGGLVLAIKDIMTGDVAISESIGVGPMIVGFLVAAVSGYFAVRYMLNIIRKGKLRYFAYYVFILGVFLLADQYFLHMLLK